MLGPLSCIVGHIQPHLTFMQPAEAGSTHVSNPLIKHPPNLGFLPEVQSASSAMGTPGQMRNAAGAAPRPTAVPGNCTRRQDSRRGEQPCGVMLCVIPVPMQVLPHASHGARQLHARTAVKPAGGPAPWRLWPTSGSLPTGEWGRAAGGALHVQAQPSASVTTPGPRPSCPRFSSLSTLPHSKSGLDACALSKAAAVLTDRPRARPPPYAGCAHLYTCPSTSLLGAVWQTP